MWGGGGALGLEKGKDRGPTATAKGEGRGSCPVIVDSHIGNCQICLQKLYIFKFICKKRNYMAMNLELSVAKRKEGL